MADPDSSQPDDAGTDADHVSTRPIAPRSDARRACRWSRARSPSRSSCRTTRSADFDVDVVAGITVAALAIPAGMAYASTAGLSPVDGLYALLLPVIAYAFLGSSRQLVVGPEGAIALLVATAVAPLAAKGSAEYASLAALLALMVAVIYLLAYVIRLGWITDYFSRRSSSGTSTGSRWC